VLESLGLDIVDHDDPFHDSIKVSVAEPLVVAPTATQNDGPTHEML
jgi:hypothetical protein